MLAHIFLALHLLLCSANPIVISQAPFYKVSTLTHDRTTVISFLEDAYRSMLPDGHPMRDPSHELPLLSRARQCFEHTSILFYVKALHLVTDDSEASECRTNLNDKFMSVVKPIANIHEHLFMHTDTLQTQLEDALVERMSHYPNLREYSFFDFSAVDYSMECLAGYQELMQVRLRTNAIRAEIEQVVSVPPVCEFSTVKQEFDGSSRSQMELLLPMNAELYCRKGRSNTCTRVTAEYKNSRYAID